MTNNGRSKTADYIWQNAKVYAQAKANRVYLDEFRKSKKHLLMAEAEQKGCKTGQERESYAYSHADYLAVLDGLKAAVEVEEELRYKLKSCEVQEEHWRTLEMKAMAEMKLR